MHDAVAAGAQYEELSAAAVELTLQVEASHGMHLQVCLCLDVCSARAHRQTQACAMQAQSTAGGMLARRQEELQALQLAKQEIQQLPRSLQQQLQGLSVCLHHGSPPDAQ